MAHYLREAKASDVSFVYDSFVKSMRNDSVLGKSCLSRIFFEEFTKVVDHILSQSKTIVACLKDDPDVIIGYIIFEPNILHYVFVKMQWWELGIARELCAHAFPGAKSLTFSNYTRKAKQILKTKPEHIYNPFVLYKRGA